MPTPKPFTPDEIRAAEIEAARAEGYAAGLERAAVIADGGLLAEMLDRHGDIDDNARRECERDIALRNSIAAAIRAEREKL